MARIFYLADGYQSLRRAAEDNAAALLALGHTLVEDCARAEFAILHLEWFRLAKARERFPALVSLPWFAYSVWETTELPPAYGKLLEGAEAVWTPSRYSAAALSMHHPNVQLVAHAVRPKPAPSPAATRRASLLVRREPGEALFLCVTKADDPRKNVGGLLAAFARVRARLPQARLIVKSRARDAPISGPGIVHLRAPLHPAVMAALYETADVYVSPHRGEAWGYTLFDAMAWGLPAVASDYSGSREFTRPDTTWLVPCREVPAPEGGMWGELDHDALAAAMIAALEAGEAKRRAALAQEDVVRRFSQDALRAQLRTIV